MADHDSYRVHDREVWQGIFRAIPKDWYAAPASNAMEEARRYLGDCAGPILDLGCGFGRWATYLASSNGAPLVGMDYAAEGVRAAKAWSTRRGQALTWVTGDVLRLPFARATFTGVLAALILDNLSRDDMPEAVAEATRVVGAGGYGFFVFNPSSYAPAAAADNPTRGCMHVVYSDAELLLALPGWSLSAIRTSAEGFRLIEGRRN
ncbi:MAG: class I SAM-dependent methyltransferase [Gemmatimonadales bacterium]